MPETQSNSQSSMIGCQLSRQPVSVLLIADDSVFANSVEAILDRPFYIVSVSQSFCDPDTVLEQHHDLIIVDCKLTALSGLNLIRRFRQYGAGVPIIFYSSTSYDDIAFTRLKDIFHVEAILHRPVQSELLIETMTRLLQERKERGNTPHPPLSEETLSAAMAARKRAVAKAHVDEDEETRALMEQLAADYIIQIPAALSEMRQSLERLRPLCQDLTTGSGREILDSVINAAHQISGTGSSIGFVELGAVAWELEERMRQLLIVEEDWHSLWCDDFVNYVDLMEGMANCSIRDLPPQLVAQSLCEDVYSASSECLSEPKDCSELCDTRVAHLMAALPAAVVEPAKARVVALVAASDSDNAGTVRTCVQNNGDSPPPFELIEVNNALSAFNLIEEHHPELLVIEARLPGLNGIETCKMIRSHPQWKLAKVLLLVEDVAKSEQAMEAGADDYLLVPAKDEQMAQKLLSLLHKTVESIQSTPQITA